MQLPFPAIIDGYQILRQIGAGGFGTVWLCRTQATGEYRALKFIPVSTPEILKKEREALIQYRTVANPLRSPNLLPIEHVNQTEQGLFYIMPLADGYGADTPEEEAWRPRTLSALIQHQKQQSSWFSSQEIINFISPVLDALQTLTDANLVHRDVKPDNILLFHGRICLGDISLLREYAEIVTEKGTPGYSAPSWYIEAGGHIDMYGVAATLYTLLTGNLPDKMGIAKFRWPPLGENSLTPEEKQEWHRIHKIIFRATEESPRDRFSTYRALRNQLRKDSISNGRSSLFRKIALLCGCCLSLIGSRQKHADNLIKTQNFPSQPQSFHEGKAAWDALDKALAECEIEKDKLAKIHAEISDTATSIMENFRNTELAPATLIQIVADMKPIIQQATDVVELSDKLHLKYSLTTRELLKTAIEKDVSPDAWKTTRHYEGKIRPPLNAIVTSHLKLRNLALGWKREIRNTIIAYCEQNFEIQNNLEIELYKIYSEEANETKKTAIQKKIEFASKGKNGFRELQKQLLDQLQ